MIIIKRLKLVLQEKKYDCGTSCLLSILNYYNCNPTKDYIERISLTSKEGTTMYGMMKVALSLGFISYGQKGNINDIEKKDLPLIAHIKNVDKNNFHYIIIESINDKKVRIKDPSIGTKIMTKEEFSKIATGNFLYIEKTAMIKKFIKRKIFLEEIVKLTKNSKKKVIIIFILSFIITILELLNFFSLKIILNNAILVKSTKNLLTFILIFLFILYLKTIFSHIIQLNLLKLEKRLNYNLKLTLMKHLLSLPNLYYQTKENSIIISLFTDIDNLSQIIFTSFFTIFNSSIIVIFIYIFFFNISSLIATFLLLGNTLLFFLIYFQRKLSKNLITKLYLTKDIYNNKLHQIVTNNEKIKGLHLEEIMYQKIKLRTDSFEDENYNLTRYSEIIKSTLTFIEGLIYLIILGIGGFLLITTTKMSLTTYLLLESLIYLSLKNSESLIIILIKYQTLKKITERLNEVFNIEKETLLPNKIFDYKSNKINIIFSNLTFKYKEKVILNNINLTINYKDKVFIYGNSGSGKSTFAKLIGRYLPITYGNIKIGNIDINHYNLTDLRNIVTYINNDQMLSKNTIKNNIYLSRKPQINQNTIIEITGLNKFFKEKNYNINTVIEENGENISMGERSRINLAQGLFKPSEIYILDECLSNVDTNLEREILTKILNYYQDKIIIFISHRLANKDLFNKVLYLEQGKCYEKI